MESFNNWVTSQTKQDDDASPLSGIRSRLLADLCGAAAVGDVASVDGALQNRVLPVCRVLSLDDREAAVFAGLAGDVLRGVFIGSSNDPSARVTSWIDQKAIRLAWKFVTSAVAVDEQSAWCGSLARIARERLAPPRAASAAVASASAPAASPPVAVAPEGVTVHQDPASGRHAAAVFMDPMGAGNGSLVATAPVPAFKPIISINGSKLFNAETVRRHCDLGLVLSRPSWKKFLDDDGEALLLTCLVYEHAKWRKTAVSHWSFMLETCPTDFSGVPTHWRPLELRALAGLSVLDEVVAKQASLTAFAASMQSILTQVIEHQSPIFDNLRSDGLESAPADEVARSVFSEAAYHWARCVFDSRSFHLKYGNRVLVTMAPVADMINHRLHGTHVLSRRIDAETGAFELISSGTLDPAGAATGEEEIVMSYGPLQSWELLLSYGFVPDPAEGVNEQDRLPLMAIADLINLEVPPPRDEGNDRDDDDNAAAATDDGYDEQRREIVRRHHLAVIDQLFIPASGVAPPLVRAVLRLCQAEAAEFPALLENPYAPGPEYLEKRVASTLYSYAQSFVESMETLHAGEGSDLTISGPDGTEYAVEDDDTRTADADSDCDDGPIDDGVHQQRLRMAKHLRSRLIDIAHRCMQHEAAAIADEE